MTPIKGELEFKLAGRPGLTLEQIFVGEKRGKKQLVVLK